MRIVVLSDAHGYISPVEQAIEQSKPDVVIYCGDGVEKVEDIVKLGDEIVVKAIGTDKKGRLNFSRKDV